jgi:hypothetical protein
MQQEQCRELILPQGCALTVSLSVTYRLKTATTPGRKGEAQHSFEFAGRRMPQLSA